MMRSQFLKTRNLLNLESWVVAGVYAKNRFSVSKSGIFSNLSFIVTSPRRATSL